MKVTVEITDGVLRDAREAATREGVTIDTLVEQGLGLVLAKRREKPFRLRLVTFGGRGLRPNYAIRAGMKFAT